MTIRETNASTDSWNKIYSVINSISDPGSKSKWVFSSYPEKGIKSKGDYPLIVIEPMDIAYDPLTFTSLKQGPLRATIDIFSSTALQLDSVTDSVMDKMENSESEFLQSGIVTMRLIGNTYGQFTRDSLRIHNKTLTYEFDFRWF